MPGGEGGQEGAGTAQRSAAGGPTRDCPHISQRSFLCSRVKSAVRWGRAGNPRVYKGKERTEETVEQGAHWSLQPPAGLRREEAGRPPEVPAALAWSRGPYPPLTSHTSWGRGRDAATGRHFLADQRRKNVAASPPAALGTFISWSQGLQGTGRDGGRCWPVAAERPRARQEAAGAAAALGGWALRGSPACGLRRLPTPRRPRLRAGACADR